MRILLFFLFLFPISYSMFSQVYSSSEIEKIKKLCMSEGGLYDIAEIIRSKNNPDLKFSAKAMNLSYDEFLLKQATSLCESYGGKSTVYTFDYDPNKRTYEYKGEFFCKAAWDKDCYITDEFIVSKGWQVCKLEYNIFADRGTTKIHKSPILWYENDDSSTPKFRGYSITLESHGEKNMLNQKSGKIGLNNMKLTAIAEHLDNEERKKCGCDMPKKTIPKPRGTGTPSQGNGEINSITYIFKSQRCSYNVYFKNTTNGNVSCANWQLKDIVSTTNQVKITVKEGESGEIVVNRKNDNPCKTGQRMWYANLVPRDMSQNVTNIKEFHDFSCN